jgi:citrate synthase
VRRAREAGERLSGFGHRVHRRDPRAKRLFELARAEGVAGSWIGRANALERALQEASGRDLALNVDGAIAALLKGLDLSPRLANALFMIARLPGLLAHVMEERETQRPMRRIVPGASRYAGPAPRTVAGHTDPQANYE